MSAPESLSDHDLWMQKAGPEFLTARQVRVLNDAQLAQVGIARDATRVAGEHRRRR